jgi:hypothetical protein
MEKFDHIESLPVPSGPIGSGPSSHSQPSEIPQISWLSPSSWMAFLQAMFDVTTADVVQRLFMAVTPYSLFKAEGNILLSRPDLYGPFWIATTAIVAMTGAANIERLFVSGVTVTDYSLMWTAAWFMYGSLAAVPLIAFAFAWIAKRRGEEQHAQSGLKYIHLVCMYGYSNLALIPVSVLCVVPIDFLQHVALILGAVNSGLFILANLWKHMPESQLRLVTVGSALVCQGLTYLAFYYFFLAPSY